MHTKHSESFDNVAIGFFEMQISHGCDKKFIHWNHKILKCGKHLSFLKRGRMQFSFFQEYINTTLWEIFLLLKGIDQSCFDNDYLFVASAKLQLFGPKTIFDYWWSWSINRINNCNCLSHMSKQIGLKNRKTKIKDLIHLKIKWNMISYIRTTNCLISLQCL